MLQNQVVNKHAVYKKANGSGWIWRTDSVSESKWLVHTHPDLTGDVCSLHFRTSREQAWPQQAEGVCQVWHKTVWRDADGVQIVEATPLAAQLAQESRAALEADRNSRLAHRANRVQIAGVPEWCKDAVRQLGGVYERCDRSANNHSVYKHTEGFGWLWRSPDQTKWLLDPVPAACFRLRGYQTPICDKDFASVWIAADLHEPSPEQASDECQVYTPSGWVDTTSITILNASEHQRRS